MSIFQVFFKGSLKMFSFLFSKSKKKANPKPVRSLFWIGAFLLLLSFIIALPIYQNAKMTPEEHWQEGLKALQEENYSKAKTHLLKSAQAQNAEAFYTLGTMEIEGKNKDNKANPVEAAIYFEKAANLGLKNAQYKLALLYDLGEGVPQDKQKALDWMLLAAAQDDLDAIYAAAVWLERGYLNGKEEPYLALSFYEEAAKRGHKNAMTTLVSIYAGGTEIPANKERSMYWKQQLGTVNAPKNNKVSNKKK